MRSEFIFIVILGFASSLPVTTDLNDNFLLIKQTLQNAEEGRNGIIENVILGTLEVLRDLMRNGSDSFPVLDPISVENINIDENTINMPGARITIKYLTVRDVSTFEMESIAFTIGSLFQRFRLDFDLFIPVVNVNASNYDLSLRVFGGQIFGNGDMSIRIVKPRVKGYFVVGFRSENNSLFIVMHECKIGIGLESFDPVITGLFGNQASSDFVSAFLRNLVRDMLDFFETEISDAISSLVLNVANTILNDFDLGSLFPTPLKV